ncbi:hypothetical protein HZA98_00470 [Candidatus Woesearchaeota archaeon]|nr:hypothetical protein [Candidatus Woesearchaeota archaeon]
MDKEVQKDILAVLTKVQPLLKQEDVIGLKMLSNETLHNASIFQDHDSISISITIFSFSKIFNQPRLCKHPGCIEFKTKITKELKGAKIAIEKSEEEHFHKHIKRMFKIIAAFEKKFGMYITAVLDHAKIKKGTRIYEHGFSSGAVAQLLGISRWELLSYLGETKVSDKEKSAGVSTKSRMALTRSLFSI